MAKVREHSATHKYQELASIYSYVSAAAPGSDAVGYIYWWGYSYSWLWRSGIYTGCCPCVSSHPNATIFTYLANAWGQASSYREALDYSAS